MSDTQADLASAAREAEAIAYNDGIDATSIAREGFEAGWDAHASWAQSQANPNALAESRSSIEKCDNELLADELERCLKRYGIDCLGPYGQDVVYKVVTSLRAQSQAPTPLRPPTDAEIELAAEAWWFAIDDGAPLEQIATWDEVTAETKAELRLQTRAMLTAFTASRGKAEQK